MGASDGTRRCQEAAEHYYDLLHHDEAVVPARIRGHVARCPFCQAQIRRLGEMLPAADRDGGPAARPVTQETVEALAAHLEWVDERVTCARVKPFLPGLAAPSAEIRVPTPITVHADHCPRCAEDAATIGALGLRAEQLERLRGVLGKPSGRKWWECRRARAGVEALGSFSSQDVDARSLSHISTCPHCRAAVYQRRRQFRAAGPGEATGPAVTSCTLVPAADLFDLVVPAGAVPADREKSRAVLRHVRACPACIERTQQLHETLYGIAERDDSGIATVYSTRDAGERIEEEAGTAVPQYPVHVQVLHGGPEPPAGRDDLPAAPAAGRPRRFAASRRASLAKIACAAAAFLLVGLLFTTSPTASGTDIGDILKAMQRQSNIHAVSSRAGSSEPFREVWVARDLEVHLAKMRAECVLLDLKKRSRKIVDFERGTCVTTRLTARQSRYAREIAIDGTGGVFAGIPSDTRLQEAATGPAGESGAGALIYELDAPVQEADRNWAVSHRYRIFVDRTTKLPQRVECFRKSPRESDWSLSTFHTFDYVTERDVRDAIRAMYCGR